MENSNKCEWKDGELTSCNDMHNALMDKSINVSRSGNLIIGELERPSYLINNCPWCACDIRKPEPEVIIKKSGGTLVIFFDSIDYMVIDDKAYKGVLKIEGYTEKDLIKDLSRGFIKPISEIEITDEIAKLRPMVKCMNGVEIIGIAEKLIHVVENQCFTLKAKPRDPTHYYSTDWMHINKCKLATVSDLED